VRLLRRLSQRVLIFGLGVLSVWLIVFVVFEDADRRLPWIVAVGLTYAVAAYIILPYAVRMGLKILHRRLIPRYTITADGLPGDPVNIVLIGTLRELEMAFAKAGWSQADPLGLVSSWRMARAFVLNSPYPTAPFSTLYLFGRRQDAGFQKPIGDSPRKRHHIRFWAMSLTHATENMTVASFWLNTDRPAVDARVLWAGAGTRDTGLGLSRLTFQITHATDADTNAERDHIIDDLKAKGVVQNVVLHDAGSRLGSKEVNHYRTDGEVAFGTLLEGAEERPRSSATGSLPSRSL
jgi:hypothetical protein